MSYISLDQNTRLEIKKHSIKIIHGHAYGTVVIGIFLIIMCIVLIVLTVITRHFLSVPFLLLFMGLGLYQFLVYRLIEIDGESNKIRKYFMIADKVIRQYSEEALPGNTFVIKTVHDSEGSESQFYVLNSDNREHHIINFNSEETGRNVGNIIAKKSINFNLIYKDYPVS